MNESQVWTTAKESSEPVTLDTLKRWKKILDRIPHLVSIDVRYTMLVKGYATLLFPQTLPLMHVKANHSPWWWPSRLARTNYNNAPSKWLWLGKRQPWWFRKWLS